VINRICFRLLAVTSIACLMLPATEFRADRESLVTHSLNGNVVTVWRYEETTRSYVKSWQPSALHNDEARNLADFKEMRVIGSPSGTPYIADYDADGVNELLVADDYGITVYGRSPAYYPFPEFFTSGDSASFSTTNLQLALADLDADGSSEFITQRSRSEGSTSTPVRRHQITIWKSENGKLKSVWTREFMGSSYVLLLADTDSDGQQELITASDTIMIMKQKAPLSWEVVAELPNAGSPGGSYTLVDVVRVADVDSDGKNEILATGNSGMLTIYKYAKQRVSGRESYPVLWQSQWLTNKDLRPQSSDVPLGVNTQGLGVGDIDGDKQLEILVGTFHSSSVVRPGEREGGRIHVFEYNGLRGFTKTWLSDRTFRASIPAFSAGDLDGDGINEFIYNGKEIYGYNRESATYELEYTLPLGTPKTAIGNLPELREPTNAIRIVPVNWTLPGRRIRLGQTADVSISLRSVWATAKDVTMEASSDSPNLIVKNGVLRIAEILGGTIVASPTFTIEAPKPTTLPQAGKEAVGTGNANLTLTITAAGGYRQSVPLRLTIAEK